MSTELARCERHLLAHLAVPSRERYLLAHLAVPILA